VDGFDTIRDLARKRHREARDAAGGEIRAASLLDGATSITGIARQAVPADDPILCGAEAILEPSAPAIFYKKNVPAMQAAFYQAHEFGHHWLHNATGACTGNDLNDTMPEEPIPLGIQRVEGYGPHERRECQANVFAREFLLPCDEARRFFIQEKLSATAIAEQLGISLSLVYQQLAHALLVPEAEPAPEAEYKNPPLDDSQKIAAEAQNRPHLIEAGPGTGKTRTLIARINWLLAQGVDPNSILALTFSNKAAEEMRDRVAITAPDASTHIWAGTFHAFGLEMLRKYGHLLDLPADVRVADPSDALLLLEEHLPSLPLSHYLRLHEPAMDLRNVLTAISRAKDELVGPAEYLAFGKDMMASAQDDSASEAAEKAIEVAGVFAAYEEILKSERIVDFADLILKTIILLRDHPEVGEAMRAQYAHILVDEYQDVNRASGILLKLLAGDGKNLWVVGDARQSIYRFRGASPENIRAFETDFPGAKRLPLAINYRSQERIVRLFEAFAPMMRASAGGLPAQWEVNRKDGSGELLMQVANNIEAEAAGLAREIIRRRDQGIPFREQAILCRSHTNLARFAMRLEAQGIPVLYLGDVFERPEIRDMLALISFTCEPERGGLLRVAGFPEYDVAIEDVRTVLSFAKDENVQPLDALKRLDEITDLTKHGRGRLARLNEHLNNIHPGTTPANLLFDYLFSQSRFLDLLLADTGVPGQQKRLALFQLLQFAVEYKPRKAGNPRHQLLQWIRRLETFGDERQLRQLPAAASGIDAVRMLTVHASKGLEFMAVYLPALGNTIFPAKLQYTPCPPPAGMLAEDPKDSHEEEEECLFFVAMSRARDVLCLSRAEKYGVTCKASPLLTKLARYLPRSPEASANWQDQEREEATEEPLSHLVPDIDVHAVEDLDQYMRCPLAYLYQRVLDLSGGREDNAYVQFHRTVYGVLRWMVDKPIDEPLHIDEALARLEVAWGETGPSDHPYAPLYRDAANTIVKRAVARRSNATTLVAGEWEIDCPNGRIKVRADQVEITPSGPVVRRLRTGRPPKKVDDDIYALYYVGASVTHGSVQVEVHYLTTDESVPVPMSDKVITNRLKKYEEAMAGINAGKFPPQPSDRHCPGCPQYFICPGIPRNS
jgi:DNA helicase II / ATP-dependent DNA helicase PcrA